MTTHKKELTAERTLQCLDVLEHMFTYEDLTAVTTVSRVARCLNVHISGVKGKPFSLLSEPTSKQVRKFKDILKLKCVIDAYLEEHKSEAKDLIKYIYFYVNGENINDKLVYVACRCKQERTEDAEGSRPYLYTALIASNISAAAFGGMFAMHVNSVIIPLYVSAVAAVSLFVTITATIAGITQRD